MTRVKYFAAFALLLLLLFVVGLVRWAADVHDDRRHTVSINWPTPLFKGAAMTVATGRNSSRSSNPEPQWLYEESDIGRIAPRLM
jgi:hypothetical protein